MNSDLQSVASRHRLNLNSNQSKIMIFSTQTFRDDILNISRMDIRFDGTAVPVAEENRIRIPHKNLGLVMDTCLKVSM